MKPINYCVYENEGYRFQFVKNPDGCLVLLQEWRDDGWITIDSMTAPP